MVGVVYFVVETLKKKNINDIEINIFKKLKICILEYRTYVNGMDQKRA